MLDSKCLMLMLIVYKLISWLCEGAIFYLIRLSNEKITVPIATWIAMLIRTLETLLLDMPSYVGTFYYPVIKTIVVFNTELDVSTLYAL